MRKPTLGAEMGFQRLFSSYFFLLFFYFLLSRQKEMLQPQEVYPLRSSNRYMLIFLIVCSFYFYLSFTLLLFLCFCLLTHNNGDYLLQQGIKQRARRSRLVGSDVALAGGRPLLWQMGPRPRCCQREWHPPTGTTGHASCSGPRLGTIDSDLVHVLVSV